LGFVSDPILILGASGGIGQAIARRLSGAGRQLILHGRDKARLEALSVQLGGACSIEAADLCDPLDAAALFERIRGAQGRLGGLVFSVAAPFSNKLAHRTAWSVFDGQISTQLKALHLSATAAYPLLADGTGTRRVVVVSSEFAISSPPIKTAPYAAAKAAMTAYAQVIAKEWLRHGIRVHIVAPGMVKTPLIAHIPDEFLPDEFLDQVAGAMPEGSLTTAEDVASMVEFMMTDAADTLYGSPIRVSRGERV
jgi:NAD(P)-dependent dehydrogenase (short-subunit alcohol dehydrogenase family)